MLTVMAIFARQLNINVVCLNYFKVSFILIFSLLYNPNPDAPLVLEIA